MKRYVVFYHIPWHKIISPKTIINHKDKPQTRYCMLKTVKQPKSTVLPKKTSQKGAYLPMCWYIWWLVVWGWFSQWWYSFRVDLLQNVEQNSSVKLVQNLDILLNDSYRFEIWIWCYAANILALISNQIAIEHAGKTGGWECIHTSSSQGWLAPARNGMKAAEFISVTLTQVKSSLFL